MKLRTLVIGLLLAMALLCSGCHGNDVYTTKEGVIADVELLAGGCVIKLRFEDGERLRLVDTLSHPAFLTLLETYPGDHIRITYHEYGEMLWIDETVILAESDKGG